MATEDHLNSSDYIKSIHQKLRDDSKKYGAEEAWRKHCKDEESLEKYACSMHNLASNHWESNYRTNSKATSRVEWIHNFCQYYFFHEEILKQRNREVEIGNKLNIVSSDFAVDRKTEKLLLLDVGSCYNPFKKYECYDVTPIDIAPARNDVHKCDFLGVKLSAECNVILDDNEISEFQTQAFDVVVFSLLLEYLPSPAQRHLCCVKAYKLLKTEGILVIITPDSKHVGANARLMKSWRFNLANLGFSRIKYEKLSYLHCMVFRKSLTMEIAKRWADLQDKTKFYEKIYIPQDFKAAKNSPDLAERFNKCDADLFEELPSL